MPDYRRSANPYGLAQSPAFNSLVASARLYTGPGDPIIQKKAWQSEAWDFWRAMGEFWYGVTWLSNAMSRVRLVAAKLQPGGDEPEILRDDQVDDPGEESSEGGTGETSRPKSTLTETDRTVVRIVEQFGGGMGGQSAIMKSLTVQLSVPGEGFVVGEQKVLDEVGTLSEATWSVKSTDEIRRKERGNTKQRPTGLLKRIGPGVPRAESMYEVQVEENRWEALSGESIVCRVWQPDDQFHWRATSAALPALPILREIDLYNRRIIADLVSRLASNGVLIIPSEATFPTRPEFKDAADPFVAELIDIASRAIKNPGSASAALPIPLRVPAELVEKFVHLTFGAPFEPGILDARDRAIKRLATTLAMPEEVLLGVQNVNHWTAWQIDESGIKIHIAPMAEIITHALTIGYLEPMLQAMGAEMKAEDGSRYVVWYDVSELTAKPDLGEAAQEAHADGSISDEAYRREKGFTEADAPDDEQLKKQLLRFLAFQGNTQAIGQLFPDLAESMTPQTPGYGPDGRPLAPEPTTVTETTQETVPSDSGASQRAEPQTPKKPSTASGPPRPTPYAGTELTRIGR
jgi:hypothetical protein